MATTKSKKSSATKKVTTRKKVSKKQSPKQMKSFKVSSPETPFMTFTIIKQTAYWLVLGVIVIVFGAWIMKLQADIQQIYDSVDAASIEQSTLPAKFKR